MDDEEERLVRDVPADELLDGERHEAEPEDDRRLDVILEVLEETFGDCEFMVFVVGKDDGGRPYKLSFGTTMEGPDTLRILESFIGAERRRDSEPPRRKN